MNKNGLSLIELLVVITIIGIISVISYPNYIKFKLETNREDAHASLMETKSIIERFLIYNNIPVLQSDNIPDFPTTSKNELYAITVDASTSSYVITATTINSQIKDETCYYIMLDSLGNKTSKDKNGVDSTECW